MSALATAILAEICFNRSKYPMYFNRTNAARRRWYRIQFLEIPTNRPRLP